MAESVIRWKRGDYIRLGQAVSQFNKKRNMIQTAENKLYLPEEQFYDKLKSRIYTRKELNRVINSLKRFSEKGAENLIENEIGELITKWEAHEIKLQTNIAIRNLNKQLGMYEAKGASGFSKAEMGNQSYRELQALKKNIEQYASAAGEKRKRVGRRIGALGTLDYEVYKAQIFKENVMDNFQYLVDYAGTELLKKRLQRITNPLSFYKFLSQTEVALDFFIWYKEGAGIQYGAFNGQQELINEILEKTGIIEDEKNKLLNKLNKAGVNAELLEVVQNINSAEDYFSILSSIS